MMIVRLRIGHYVDRLGNAVGFVSSSCAEISFHFVNLLNAKDLRQVVCVGEMK